MAHNTPKKHDHAENQDNEPRFQFGPKFGINVESLAPGEAAVMAGFFVANTDIGIDRFDL